MTPPHPTPPHPTPRVEVVPWAGPGRGGWPAESVLRASASDWVALLGPGEVSAENEATIAELAERLALAPQEASGVAIGGTGTITQALGTTDVLGYTVGVLFMMSNSTSNPYTFQVYDWRAAASNGFYVEVTTNTTSGVGDSVTVTFDTSRYTNSGAPWKMIVFYTQVP